MARPARRIDIQAAKTPSTPHARYGCARRSLEAEAHIPGARPTGKGNGIPRGVVAWLQEGPLETCRKVREVLDGRRVGHAVFADEEGKPEAG